MMMPLSLSIPPSGRWTVQSLIVTGLQIGRKGNRILVPEMGKKFPYKAVSVRFTLNFILGVKICTLDRKDS
jgi:hypothetical protein